MNKIVLSMHKRFPDWATWNTPVYVKKYEDRTRKSLLELGWEIVEFEKSAVAKKSWRYETDNPITSDFGYATQQIIDNYLE